ncbi:MAG: beta-galactosidase [Phycisphaerales bacterium]
MSHQRIASIVALICCVGIACGVGYADTLFEDNFNNSNPTDVKGENPDFWTKSVPADSRNGTLTEASGGPLNQTIGSSNFQGGNQVVALFSNQKTISDTFNFFVPHAQPKTFSGSLSLTSNLPNFWDNTLRISLTSENKDIYSANDGLSLRFRGGQTSDPTKKFDVILAYKINKTNANPDQGGTGTTILVNNGTPGNPNGYPLFGTLTGYALTLDESDYTLIVYYNDTADIPTSYVRSGTWGADLTQADWGDGSGYSMLQLENRLNIPIGDRQCTALWTDLAMTSPDLFEDNFNNGNPANVSGESPDFWSTAVPADPLIGTLTEDADGLHQVIGSSSYPGGNNAVTLSGNQKTPSETFNFFVPAGQGKTLTGALSLASTFPNYWDNTLRISLTSENKDIWSANDGLSLRFRGGQTSDPTKRFDVLLAYKINTPNANPDQGGTGTNILVNNGTPGNTNGYSLFGTLTGYALTLDESNYTLIVYYNDTSGNPQSHTWAGAFGADLTKAAWGDGSGKSMLQLEHRVNTTAGNKQSAAIWKHLAMKGPNGTATVLTHDGFDNGNPTDISGENPDFWTKSVPADSRNGTLTEATGGPLNQTIGSSNYQGGNNAVVLYSNQTTTSDTFNFFVPSGHAKTMTGSLSLTSNLLNYWDNTLRISLTSENKDIYSANDGLSLRFRGGQTSDPTKRFDVLLAYKINTPNANPDQGGTGTNILVNNGTPGNTNGYSLFGTLTGYAMTLDQSNYTLIVYYTNTSGVPTSQTWTGAFGTDMTKAAWGDGSGKSMLQLENRLNIPVGDRVCTALWSHLAVTGQPWTVAADDNWKNTDLSDLIIQAGTALDMSFIQDAPAGKHGLATINSNGDLVFTDRPDAPVRMLCENYNMDHIGERLSPFTHVEIDAVADQMARMGFNTFRPHNLDGYLTRGSTADCVLKPDALEKWDYLSNALKQRGIYLFLDLTTYSSYSKTDYWTDAGKAERLRSRLYWDDAVGHSRDIWRTGVTNLLTHVNPYSGVALKDEPQVLVTQTRNEANLLVILQGDAALGYAVEQGMIDKFHAWLTARYATIAALNQAWGASYASFNDVPFPALNIYTGPIAQDLYRFCIDSDKELFLWMKGILDGLYVSVPVTDFNYVPAYHQAFTRDVLPLVDMHSYHEHPSNYSSSGSWQRGLSAVDPASGLGYLCDMASTRHLGRPMTASETGQPYWNAWRMEAGLLWPSFAALQGWSMVSPFAHAALLNSTNSRCYPDQPFLLGIDPPSRAAQLMASMLYHRGDVVASPHIIQVNVDPEQVIQTNNVAWSMAGLPKLSMLCRLGIQIPAGPDSAPRATYTPALSLTTSGGSEVVYINGAAYTVSSGDYSPILTPAVDQLRSSGVLNSSNQTNIANNVYQSDTNQILIQMQTKHVEVKTNFSEGGTLLPNGGVMNLNVLLSAQNNGTAPVAVFLGSLDSLLDQNTNRMLLVLASDALNTGDVFKSRDRQELVTLGHLPVLTHVANVHLRIQHNSSTPLRLWALRFNGTRAAEIPLTPGTGYFDADINTADPIYFPNGPTPFFELAEN